ncbi:sulfotransferase family protein [Actinomadura monticuli]|uniref:Sulfotransferase n=1 Tax=Actinomadura monticuli TaxID=3097367 RepID=A0ABV4Q4K2_9ACTN
MAATSDPILIIGTERSGSNLLRLILNAHPRIAVPHPPHFLHYLTPIVGSYGPLDDERNRWALARDALRLLSAHIHPWDHPIDEARVVAEAKAGLAALVAGIHDEYREAAGKARWGCKSTFNVDYVDDLRAVCADARFIWLVRDPRDVAASAKHSVFGPCHPYRTGLLWRRQQTTALAARNRLGPGVVHLLRYEELVADPKGRLTELCAFLDEPFEPAMLEHHRSAAAHRLAGAAGSWRATGLAIGDRSVGRFRRELAPNELRQVEAGAGPLMRELGYRPESPPRGGARPSPASLALREASLRCRVEWRSLRTDANVLARWRRDVLVRRLRLKAAARMRGAE